MGRNQAQSTGSGRPSINRYKGKDYKPDVRTEQVGDESAIAEAQGQGRIAQEQAQLSNTFKAGTAMEVKNLGQRLQIFNDNIIEGANTGANAFRQYANDKGIEDVNQGLVDKNNQIRQIESQYPSMNLTDEQYKEKQARINDISLDLKSDFNGIYGEAFNKEVKVNYNNDVIVSAAEAAQQALELANQDPEKYKEIFLSYKVQALQGAPDNASNLVAERAYDKAGAANYKKLYTSLQAKNQAAAADKDKYVLKRLETMYKNQIADNNMGEATETRAQIEIRLASRVANGRMSNEAFIYTMEQLDISADVQKTSALLNRDLNAGDGIKALENFDIAQNQGKHDLWPVGTSQKIRNGVIEGLKSIGATAVAPVIETIKEGRDASPDEMALVKKYKDYLSPDKSKELSEGLKTNLFMKQYKQLPIGTQKEIARKAQESSTSNEELQIAMNAEKMIEEKVKRLGDDPYQEGELDNYIDYTELSMKDPGFAGNFITRISNNGILEKKYGEILPIFSKEEKVEIKTFLESNIPGMDKMAVIKTIVDATSNTGKFEKVMDEIDANPDFTSSAYLVKLGQPVMAVKALEGNQLLKDKVLTFTATDVKKELTEEIFNPQANLNSRYLKDLQNIAIGLIAEKNKSAEDKDELTGVDDVILSVYGESVEVNNQEVFAPVGVTEDDFENWLASAAKVEAYNKDVPLDIEHTQRLLDLSIPVKIGPDKYGFEYNGETINKEDGTPFIFTYKKTPRKPRSRHGVVGVSANIY